MTLEVRLGVLALVFFISFLALGYLVTTRRLSQFDVRAGNLHGMSTDLAVIFTLSGRSIPLLTLAAISLAIFFAARQPLWIPITIFVSQVASQG
ncbi:MAG: hypothetical protein M3N19_02475, partial [Candidatus Eremiobacteraeota bacterium]|nr:hypothetical protein [Candidatus Eremiobacteraeota bacterium]